VGIRDTGSG